MRLTTLVNVAALLAPQPQLRAPAPRVPPLRAEADAAPTALDPVSRAAIVSRMADLRREIAAKELEVDSIKARLGDGARPGWQGEFARATETLAAAEWRSTEVLLRAVSKQQDPLKYLAEEAESILRYASNPGLAAAYLRHSDKLAAHAPAIYSRAKQLEPYAPGLVGVVDDWLPVIEPHLDLILERFNEIEPHLPWVIENIDALAPHCGPLLRHMDELMLYADEDEAYLPALSPYIAYFAPRLDALGPHLPLLRPHLSLVMPHLHILGRYADRFVPHVAASANADILVHYFGWALRIPYLHNFLALPGMPRAVAFISRTLPKRPVRGPTADYECDWEECDVSYVANANRYYGGIKKAGADDVQAAVQEALGKKKAERELARSAVEAGASEAEP